MGADGYITIPVRSALLRRGACAVVLAAAAYAAFAAGRVAIGETVFYLSDRGPIPASALERARELDPSNPDGAYSLALVQLDVRQPPDYDEARRLLEAALAEAPSRHEYWLTLGRLEEQTGRSREAEAAFKRSASLAPSFWKPRWMLGNLYVRLGRIKEAATELGFVSEQYSTMAPMAIRTVWQASDKDVALTASAAGRGVVARAALLTLLVKESRADEALDVWRDLQRDGEGEAAAPGGRELATLLLQAGRADEAVEVWGVAAPDLAPALDQIRNPGFEEPVAAQPESPFAWAVNQAQDGRVSAGAGRTGGKALRVDYNSKTRQSFSHASQLVRVRPNATYALTYWASTDGLQSGGLPTVTVGDPARGAALTSRPIPAGTSEWTSYRIEFKAPASGIVSVAVVRNPCGEMCPIFGTFSVDDFGLEALAR